MLERFYFGLSWIGVSVDGFVAASNAKRERLPRICVRRPVVNIPLLDGPAEAISLDFFGPPLTMSEGKQHSQLIADLFDHHVSMHAMSAAEATTIGTTDNPFRERRLHPALGVDPNVDDQCLS